MIREQKRAEQKSRVTQKLYIRQMNYDARILTMRVKRESVARGLVTFVIAREIKIRAVSSVRPVDLCFRASRGVPISKMLKKIASRRVANTRQLGERFEFLCSPTATQRPID